MHICTCLNKHLNSHLALLGAQIVYALNYSIAKGLMPQFISPTVLVFYRIVGAMFLFYALSLFLPKEKVSKREGEKIYIGNELYSTATVVESLLRYYRFSAGFN